MTPRVKICGLTRREDAMAAVHGGADALGFVFWDRSPRAVHPDVAAAICREIPAFVTRVGVFVNQAPAEVRAIVDSVGLDAVQLHGDERVDDYLPLRVRVIKAVAGSGTESLADARAYPRDVVLLVDALDRERRGGTGRLANWAFAAALARDRPIVLAGGLAPENVADAIRHVRPWAIDVSSGVERAPGIKDSERLARLFTELAAARVGMEERT